MDSMAYVLSLPQLSPLKRSFSDTSYMRTGSPLADDNATLRHHKARNVSASSLLSLEYFKTSGAVTQASQENLIPSTGKPSSPFVSTPNKPLEIGRGLSQRVPGKSGWETQSITPLRTSSLPSPNRSPDFPYGVNIRDRSFPYPVLVNTDRLEEILASLDESCGPVNEETLSIASSFVQGSESHCASSYHDAVSEHAVLPSQTHFRRWMSTLRKRRADVPEENMRRLPRNYDRSYGSDDDKQPLSGHTDASKALHKRALSLSSSMGFVTTVKSASITLASGTLAPWTSSCLSTISRREPGMMASSDVRVSMDSGAAPRAPLMDERSWERARKRGEILSELLATEESYIGDMKALVNVYFTLLASVPAFSTRTRRLFHRNVAQIIQLHEDLLRELQTAVPGSENGKDVATPALHACKRPRHVRWKSAEAITEREVFRKLGRPQRHSVDIRVGSSEKSKHVIDTMTAGNVAKVFNRNMKRLFVYEQYVANFEDMKKDMEQTRESVPLSDYERGIEALSTALLSINHRDTGSKKGLTVQDLFIKPIQRVTKLCLILENLCKQTPVYDDPESHAELEKALFRLRETNREIDRATDNPAARKLMEISWLLQDRFEFDQQTISRPILFSLLGHVLLCGVLHVAYNSFNGVAGQYMICALYRSCLLVAIPSKSYSSYTVVATIALAGGALDEPDNGRGLQCFTASFTWKLIFQSEHKLFEIVMSACSSEEEEQWRQQLKERIAAENHDFAEGRLSVQDVVACRGLELKSLGSVFGQSDTFVRRLSVHRAHTLGPRINVHQVIIKNTQARKLSDPQQQSVPVAVTRSQSLLSSTNIPILTPRRAERIRLENALADVWTKDALPYPGMASRRTENPIRASANAVMRKMSMASLTSNFSRRSASVNNLSRRRAEDAMRSGRKTSPPVLMTSHIVLPKRPAQTAVDFHNDPLRFLPTDFDLQDRRHGRIQKTGRNVPNRNSLKASRRVSRPTSFIGSRARPRSDISMAIEASSSSLNQYNVTAKPPGLQAEDMAEPAAKAERKSSTTSAGLGPISKQLRKQKSKLFKFWL